MQSPSGSSHSLKSIPEVTRCSIAGSVRRKKETVGDLTFVVGCDDANTIFDEFQRFGGVHSHHRPSGDRASYRLKNLAINLAWSSDAQWGWTLVHETGSVEHLQELEAEARTRGIPFTEIAFAGKGIDVSTEKRLYTGLGLAFIEPELREGRGEVAAAAWTMGRCQNWCSRKHFKGDLHMHTTASDGANTLLEMARRAGNRPRIPIYCHHGTFAVTTNRRRSNGARIGTTDSRY